MTTHGQNKTKKWMREQLPISCQLLHWCCLWEAGRELPPPPFGTACHCAEGKGNKGSHLVWGKLHLHSPSWCVSKGPFQERRKKVHLLTASTSPASSISHIGMQISCFPCFPLLLRNLKFQLLFESSQSLCISQAFPPAWLAAGVRRRWERGQEYDRTIFSCTIQTYMFRIIGRHVGNEVIITFQNFIPTRIKGPNILQLSPFELPWFSNCCFIPSKVEGDK